LLSPVLLIAIYALFLGVMRFPIDLPVLVSGILVWQFLSLCVGDSVHAIVGNANLVTKSAFPPILLPLATVLANLVNFLLSLAVLSAYLAWAGATFGGVLWLPGLVLTQTALCLGMGLILSCANVFFRDVEHMLSTILLAWFFVTPVIYPVEMVTSRFTFWVHALFFANPMTGLVAAYRMAFLSSPGPGVGWLALSFAAGWGILALGLAVFRGFERRFGDEL
jgi:ABC-type polysaccharide/polyol phosphate export permease